MRRLPCRWSTHVLEDGQHEGGRLAGARLGAADDVAAGEHARDGLRLDRASAPSSPSRRRRRAACPRGQARRTPGSRPQGPAHRAARCACARCSSRRRPGRRGRRGVRRGCGHARHGPCRRGRHAVRARPGGRGSRRAHRSARCARRRLPARPGPEPPSGPEPPCRPRPANLAPAPSGPAERRPGRRSLRRRCRGDACRRACGGAPRPRRTRRSGTNARWGQGWSCRWYWGSQILSSLTTPYAATLRSLRRRAFARLG